MTPRELLDHPIVSERYFFPRADAPAGRWVVEVGGERLVGARVYGHRGAAVLHFHGNGETVADWIEMPLAAALVEGGLDLYFGEYRGYGASSGRPALAAMLDDALAVHDATGVPPERTVVYGRSVGSIYALHVAAHRPVAGLVLESGIADVLERLLLRVRPEELGASEEALAAAVGALCDHETKMRATACPVLVLHAVRDHLVSPAHAEALARWAGARGELVLFPDGDHNSIHAFNGDALAARVLDFARRCLGGSPESRP